MEPLPQNRHAAQAACAVGALGGPLRAADRRPDARGPTCAAAGLVQVLCIWPRGLGRAAPPGAVRLRRPRHEPRRSRPAPRATRCSDESVPPLRRAGAACCRQDGVRGRARAREAALVLNGSKGLQSSARGGQGHARAGRACPPGPRPRRRATPPRPTLISRSAAAEAPRADGAGARRPRPSCSLSNNSRSWSRTTVSPRRAHRAPRP